MHMMKNVLNFLEDHVISDEVIILGQCPSSKTQPFKNGTFARQKPQMTVMIVSTVERCFMRLQQLGDSDAVDYNWSNRLILCTCWS